MIDTIDFLRTLPHNTWLNGKEPWMTAQNCYPLYTKVAGILRPQSILEIGAFEGHGLVSFLIGHQLVTHLSWVDNQSYLPDSNQRCCDNLLFALEKLNMTDKVGLYCDERLDGYLYHDLIHVDGDHSLAGCLLDLTWAYCQNPRYILVDDYLNNFTPGVASAVQYFSGRTGLTFKTWKTYRGWAAFALRDGDYANLPEEIN